MVSHYTDYPYRRRRRPYTSRYQGSRRYPSGQTRRYTNTYKKKRSGRTEYSHVKGMGYVPTYGYYGGSWSTRSVIGADSMGNQILGPWSPAIA